MNKFLVISIGVAVGVGIIMLIAFKFLIGSFGQPSSGSPTTTNTPGTGSNTTYVNVGSSGTTATTTTQGVTIPLSTPGGKIIQVKDFRSNPTFHKDPTNEGYYYLGYHYGDASDPTATANPPYVVEYVSSTQYFNVTLLQEPIADTRKEVEQYIEEYLGISEAEMCQLEYTVSVPNSVNQIYAGQDLRFSFCEGAVQL